MFNLIKEKMNSSKLKASLFASFLILMVPTVAFAAQSYSVNYEFKRALKGQVRYFDAGNISLSLSSKSNVTKINTFSVTLNKKTIYGSKQIGSTLTAYRNGSSSKTWREVDSGDYFLYFSKVTDDEYVRGWGNFKNAK